MKTSAASLAAGATMLLIFSSELLRERLVPAAYQAIATKLEIPVLLGAGMAIVSYARRVAARQGEPFPF
jgi:hypothetical protein